MPKLTSIVELNQKGDATRFKDRECVDFSLSQGYPVRYREEEAGFQVGLSIPKMREKEVSIGTVVTFGL